MVGWYQPSSLLPLAPEKELFAVYAEPSLFVSSQHARDSGNTSTETALALPRKRHACAASTEKRSPDTQHSDLT